MSTRCCIISMKPRYALSAHSLRALLKPCQLGIQAEAGLLSQELDGGILTSHRQDANLVAVVPPGEGGESAGGGDVAPGGDPEPVVTGGLVELEVLEELEDPDEPSTGAVSCRSRSTSLSRLRKG